MKTRIEKLETQLEDYAPKRVSKNLKLYDDIKNSDLNNFNLGSNAKVIGDNESQIDINKIKELLEKNYQDTPKKRSMKFDIPEETEVLEMEKTREYDINAILEQAREEKDTDYQKERLKKIRDTQFDILKSLELEAKSKTEAKEPKEELMELINTINLNEIHNKNGKTLEEAKKELEEKEKEKEEYKEETEQLDPLDILSDLKGDENTVVVGAKKFEEEMKLFETQQFNTAPINLVQEEEEEEGSVEIHDQDMDNSFYTNSMTFNKKDFSDFDDLKDKDGSAILNVLIVIVFIAIVVGMVIFLNEFLELGWFMA